jgi:hypothetical protein
MMDKFMAKFIIESTPKLLPGRRSSHPTVAHNYENFYMLSSTNRYWLTEISRRAGLSIG